MANDTSQQSTRSGRNLIIGTVVALVLVVVAAVLLRQDPKLDYHPLVGSAAPEIRFQTEEGKSVSTEEYKGKALLLNFWAVWCQPCLEEMPSLAALEKHFESQGLVVLAFNIESEGEDIRGTLSGLDMPRNLIVNFSKAQLRPYDVRAIPLSVLIDRKGVIQQVYEGPIDWMHIDTVREVEKALSERSG